MLGFLTLRGCRSIGADNTVCLAFLVLSLGFYASFYLLGLFFDYCFQTGMLIRILLTSAYSVHYLLTLPSEIRSMQLGAARLEKKIDETF